MKILFSLPGIAALLVSLAGIILCYFNMYKYFDPSSRTFSFIIWQIMIADFIITSLILVPIVINICLFFIVKPFSFTMSAVAPMTWVKLHG